ncbi:hypothetical protein V8G69_07660 [Gaetbulibacter sp. M235]|uniref:hypothetical protein n=1 Tax=Gaetbulibacter sp. M235 TaxID=3126510 RepID=UPI00374F2A78
MGCFDKSRKVKAWQYGSDLITDWNVGMKALGYVFVMGVFTMLIVIGVNEIL